MAVTFTKPADLAPASTVTGTAAIIVDNGVTVEKATPRQIVDAGRPISSESQAVEGTDNQTTMTPLTVKQAIDADTSGAVAQAQAWAESPTAPGDPGTKSAKTWAGEAADDATAAAASADKAELFDGPKFDTIDLMALYADAEIGDVATVWNAFNGGVEHYDMTAGGLTADGVLVVDGVGGQWVSKRTVYADWAGFKADPRPHPAGTSVSLLNGSDTYKAVASGGNTGLTNAGGQQFVATSTTITVQTFGADNTGTVEAKPAFDNAMASFSLVYMPDGAYRIDDANGVTIPQGVTLYSHNKASIYYRGLPAAGGVKLLKDAASANGPIIKMTTSSGLHGVLLDNSKEGSMQDGIINMPGTALLANPSMSNVYIIGKRTTSVDLDQETGNAGFGIKFEHCPTTSTPSFFASVDQVHITECDVGIRLGQLCNANTFNGVSFRNCHVEVDIFGNDISAPGGNLSIENNFTGSRHMSIGTITPRPVSFRLKYARQNIFSGYVMENYGKEFEIDAATCVGNIFDGVANAAIASEVPGPSNVNQRDQRVNNFNMKTRMPLITSAGADDRNIFTGGGTFRQIFQVEGAMPTQGNTTGALIAGNASSKTIIRLPENFTKSRKCSFTGKIKVFVYGAFGNGTGVVDVTFGYSMRSQSTSAGEFKVFAVNQMGDEITGLHFLTGVASGLPMGVALVCGNYGASAISWVRCELEIFVTDILSTEDTFTDYMDLTSTTTADITADDVTDGITMLTVGATTV